VFSVEHVLFELVKFERLWVVKLLKSRTVAVSFSMNPGKLKNLERVAPPSPSCAQRDPHTKFCAGTCDSTHAQHRVNWCLLVLVLYSTSI